MADLTSILYFRHVEKEHRCDVASYTEVLDEETSYVVVWGMREFTATIGVVCRSK
jgi:hypothetical protein